MQRMGRGMGRGFSQSRSTRSHSFYFQRTFASVLRSLALRLRLRPPRPSVRLLGPRRKELARTKEKRGNGAQLRTAEERGGERERERVEHFGYGFGGMPIAEIAVVFAVGSGLSFVPVLP